MKKTAYRTSPRLRLAAALLSLGLVLSAVVSCSEHSGGSAETGNDTASGVETSAGTTGAPETTGGQSPESGVSTEGTEVPNSPGGDDSEGGNESAGGSGGADDDISGASLALLSSVSVVTMKSSESDSSQPSISSGVMLDIDRQNGDAYIMTNFHVVYDKNGENGICRKMYIYLYGAYIPAPVYAPLTGIPAEFIGGSAEYDIAVLKVTGSSDIMESDAVALRHADSDDITAGDELMIIGNAKSSGVSLTSGVVSVPSEYIYTATTDDFPPVRMRLIRTDAVINHGNSGGGAFDKDGALVGIVVARSAEEDTFGFGYLIPSNIAVFVAENIIDSCDGDTFLNPSVARIGIALVALETRAVYDEEIGKVRIVETVAVYSVSSDSEAFGLLSYGDIVTGMEINGYAYDITYSYEAIDLVITCRAGDELTLYAEDNETGEELVFTMTLTADDFTARE